MREVSAFVPATLLALILLGCTAPEISHPTVPRTGGEPAEFAGIVAAHNRWRRQVSTPPLSWSDNAAKQAERWAKALAKNNCEIAHSPKSERSGRWGENVFGLWRGGEYDGYRRSATAVVDSWASERQWYDAQAHRCDAPAKETCAHYTQVVSTTSMLVGCARARCPRAEIWVCNYSPPGNFADSAPF